MATTTHIPAAVVRRLPGYYRHLAEREQQGETRISSQEMSERLGLTASQIRQDINCIGGIGQQGFGYHIHELKARIAEILGMTRSYHMIILGAGNLGRALANYASFRQLGYEVCAVFDNATAMVGKQVAGLPVQSIDTLEAWLAAHPVDIGVLCVPPDNAQEAFDRLVDGGVRGIWNFAPIDLKAPPNVALNNVHLSDSLQILSYRMREIEGLT